MNTRNNKYRIILASESPRRKRLLEQAKIPFEVIPSRIDEEAIEVLLPEIHARTLAEAKAGEVSRNHPERWVIGGDSIVVIDDTIINKPASRAHAYEMLSQLSGRTHRVITGYSIQCRAINHCQSDICITEVTFKTLSDAEIRWYLDTPEPWDKAGAYAIQGIGAFMVKSIQGSYTNVVGMPVCEVWDHLLENGVIDRVSPQINIAGSPGAERKFVNK
ncbi:MAG: septum formation protein Maf [Desulfobacterales bacterium]|nr:septum formation protein Maf [Desulfobacterales bacterium]